MYAQLEAPGPHVLFSSSCNGRSANCAVQCHYNLSQEHFSFWTPFKMNTYHMVGKAIILIQHNHAQASSSKHGFFNLVWRNLTSQIPDLNSSKLQCSPQPVYTGAPPGTFQ
uniref:Uncharacterized protein n=1 Tax=Pyxicephalus adspersus TaxID=30357 RepID=A0AAV2ZUY6_PYXAD|nr:TPA: hypothetical protein GDO54_017274 [Pyxicephalus adspersus]